MQTSDSAATGFDNIRDDELTQEVAQSSREVMYRRLTEDLIRQIQLSARNQQVYAHMGGANNLARAKEFQALEQRSNQDLERLKQAAKNGSLKPVFHYEKRQMHLVQFNNDLTDDDLEVSIHFFVIRNTQHLTLIIQDKMIVYYFYSALLHRSHPAYSCKPFERTFFSYDDIDCFYNSVHFFRLSR